jgi:RNA polymerase nonessential primary-like sigma factor
LHERHRKIKKVIRDYRIQNSNRAPTLAEIAELTECSLGQVEDAIKHCRPIFSLNHKTNPEEGTELLELMGVTMPDSSEAVEAKAVIESVLESIAFWGQSDRELFILRHGLGGEEPLSLAKIAVRLGMKVEQAKGVEMRNKKKFDRIAKVRFPEYVQNSSTP